MLDETLHGALQRGIGDRIRARRVERGLTLRRMAGELGVSAATLSAVETGRTGLSAVRLFEVAELLTVSVEALLAPETVAAAAGPEPAATGPAAVAEDWRRYEPLVLEPTLLGALAAFLERGYAGATMRDVGRHAGLSVPGLYHHHAGKQQLLVALLEIGMEELLTRSRAARAEGRTPVERFTLLVECLALFHTHRAAIGFLGASEMRSLLPAARERVASTRREQQHMVDTEVAGACRDGSFATPQPREAARAVVTMCTALAQWYSPEGPMTPEEIADHYVEFALDVVAYRPDEGD